MREKHLSTRADHHEAMKDMKQSGFYLFRKHSRTERLEGFKKVENPLFFMASW